MEEQKSQRMTSYHYGIMWLIMRIIIVIALIEFGVMHLLDALPFEFGAMTEAAVDAVLLALLSVAPIYFWVVRPYVLLKAHEMKRLDELAHRDPLTQLSNRRQLHCWIDETIQRCQHLNRLGAVLMIDLNGFKGVNDVHGHAVGDAILIEVARRLKSSTRDGDRLCRVGGDEFVVLLPEIGVDSIHAHERAGMIARRIHKSITEPILHQSCTHIIGASVGVCVLDQDSAQQGAEAVLQAADEAMYKAKHIRRAVHFSHESSKDDSADLGGARQA